MRNPVRVAVSVCIWLMSSVAAAGAQQPSPQPVAVAADTLRWARVTYLSGRSVYVSAGRDDGLEEGAAVIIVRHGAAIATVRATFLSSHRASGEIVHGGDTVAVIVGDSARFVVRSARPRVAVADTTTLAAHTGDTLAPIPPTQPVAANDAGRSLRALGIRGRLGLRYLIVAQGDSGGVRFTQPAADVRVDGQRIAGTPLGFSLDARGRRTYASSGTASGAETDARTYVYHLSMALATTGGARVAIGRQFSEAFGNVSLYDGVSAELARRSWGAGVFAGTQPAPTTMSYATDVREAGGYVQARGAAGDRRRWSMTVGAVGSYHASDLNREFAFGQLVVSTTRLSLHAVQEVDYNRGWKSAAGERTLQPTSTYLSVHLQPSEPVTLSAGFDSRRNVRLWRDLVSPETEFDDRFRQGVWGSASVRAGSHVRFSADVRSSDGGDSTSSRATAAGGTFSVDRMTRAALGLRARSTRYRSPWLEGWLHSATVSVSPWDGRVRVEAEGGIRTEHDRAGVAVSSDPGASPMHWLGINTEAALGRSWYLLLTTAREMAGWESTHQTYASLTWRF